MAKKKTRVVKKGGLKKRAIRKKKARTVV